MELNEKNVSKLAQIFGMSAEDMTAKLTGEETDFELKGTLFTEDELKARDNTKYKEGKEAGVEMEFKKLRDKYGYTDLTGKTIENFLEYHEGEINNKYSKSSTERITELENDLKKQKGAFEEEINTYKSQLETMGKQYKQENIKNTLRSIMPKETILKPDALITLFNSEYEIDQVEGKTVVKKNGETLKDAKTTEPLELNSIFNDWLVKEKYVSAAPGRGGDNEFGGSTTYSSIKTPMDFQQKWIEKNPGKSTSGSEYQEDYAKWRETQKSA